MHQQQIDIQSISYHLWRQALSGDPDGTLLALEQMDCEELPVLAADLLARLYVRAGRLAEAKTLWQRILQADPNYAPAAKALNKLDSPWLIRAVTRRYSLWFAVGGLLLFALYGLGMLFFGDKDASFALVGTATILTVLGVYLAGLFGWAFMTVVSLFGFGQSIYSSRMQPGRGRESQSGCLDTNTPHYRR
ncbi:MAG: hypothetical protein WBC05_18805 [Sedimentisphaerales bacterium]